MTLIDHSSLVDDQGIADCMSKLNLLTGTTRFNFQPRKINNYYEKKEDTKC